MKDRCYNPNNKRYPHYGGRGIVVCQEWKDNYVSFRDWAICNGYQIGLSLDRINNDGNYSPDNCRWATPKQQAYNRRTNRLITIQGKTQTVTEWAEEVGISIGAFQNRLRYGWSEERLLEPQQPQLKMSKHEMRLEILKLRKELEMMMDKIESGKLVELPAPLGSELWTIKYPTRKIGRETVTTVSPKNATVEKCRYQLSFSNVNMVGKYYFLTKAEAEARLKALKGE